MPNQQDRHFGSWGYEFIVPNGRIIPRPTPETHHGERALLCAHFRQGSGWGGVDVRVLVLLGRELVNCRDELWSPEFTFRAERLPSRRVIASSGYQAQCP